MKQTKAEIFGEVLADVWKERKRQDAMWGEQHHDFPTWYTILGEEYGEVGQAIQRDLGLKSIKESDAHNTYTELIHLAAVAVKMAEKIRQNGEMEK